MVGSAEIVVNIDMKDTEGSRAMVASAAGRQAVGAVTILLLRGQGGIPSCFSAGRRRTLAEDFACGASNRGEMARHCAREIGYRQTCTRQIHFESTIPLLYPSL